MFSRAYLESEFGAVGSDKSVYAFGREISGELGLSVPLIIFVRRATGLTLLA